MLPTYPWRWRQYVFLETLVSTYHTPLTQETTVFMFTIFRLSHLTQCSLCDCTVAETVTYAILELPRNVKDGIMRDMWTVHIRVIEKTVNAKLKNESRPNAFGRLRTLCNFFVPLDRITRSDASVSVGHPWGGELFSTFTNPLLPWNLKVHCCSSLDPLLSHLNPGWAFHNFFSSTQFTYGWKGRWNYINKNPTRCNSMQSDLFYCKITLHVSDVHRTHHQEY